MCALDKSGSRGVLRIFARTETGAVALDWCILTASMMGMGMAAAIVLSSGPRSLAGSVAASMSGAQVAQLDCGGDADCAAPVAMATMGLSLGTFAPQPEGSTAVSTPAPGASLFFTDGIGGQ